MKRFAEDTGQLSLMPGEGDFFKIIRLYGRSFEIRYGFYEERDRYTPFAEPVPIYPDFIKLPQYTDDGAPFVTAMQSPCPSFDGKRDANSVCEDCSLYRHGDELIGICTCRRNCRGHGNANINANTSVPTCTDETKTINLSTEGGHPYD